jgi:4-hydroxy-3-methylbut-2-enyl diphosphate reductase
VAELVRAGFHPVIIGKRDHVEVRGIVEDLQEYDVILHESDVEKLREQPRFGVACQTTQPIDRALRLVELIRLRFPNSEVRFADTVCHPTKQRQASAIELAKQSDIVIVIGGSHSNNTKELAQTCRKHCARVFHVQTAADLDPAWFHSAGTVGITAGTSTPDTIIDAVQERLEEIALSRTEACSPREVALANG